MWENRNSCKWLSYLLGDSFWEMMNITQNFKSCPRAVRGRAVLRTSGFAFII